MTDYGGNIPQGGAYPAGGGYDTDEDLRGASEHASRSAAGSGDDSLFTTILGALKQKKQSLADEDVDEDDAVKQHRRYYDEDDKENDADDRSLGSAAAMQALKLFTGGSQADSNSAQGNSQSAFVGLAMAEASKLFDQKASEGKVSGETSKESAVMKAGEMALKFYLKSQGGSSGSGGGDGGSSKADGASALLNLASKFLAK